MKKLVSLIAVLAIVSAASAATSVSWEKSTAPNGMDSYIVTLTGSANISAVDVTFTGDAINQVLAMGQAVVYSDFAAFLGADAGNDSHFLINSATVLPVAGTAIESATSLAASFGIPGADQDPVLALAQIIVPTGGSFHVGGSAAVNAQQDMLDVTVPEPATMALLAFGGLGLLARRKR